MVSLVHNIAVRVRKPKTNHLFRLFYNAWIEWTITKKRTATTTNIWNCTVNAHASNTAKWNSIKATLRPFGGVRLERDHKMCYLRRFKRLLHAKQTSIVLFLTSIEHFILPVDEPFLELEIYLKLFYCCCLAVLVILLSHWIYAGTKRCSVAETKINRDILNLDDQHG